MKWEIFGLRQTDEGGDRQETARKPCDTEQKEDVKDEAELVCKHKASCCAI